MPRVKHDRKTTSNPEAVHYWFGLSYAAYLVIPRTVLQSLSPEVQERFVALMDDIQKEIDYDDPPGGYRVLALDRRSKFTRDPLADYERGRRRISRTERGG